MINYLGDDIINLNEEEKIIISSNEKNNIFWKEVYFISGSDKSFIGSFFTNRDVLSHNDYYIAILKLTYDENNNPVFKAKKIYDIKNHEFIIGTEDDLTEFYQNNFYTERIVNSL